MSGDIPRKIEEPGNSNTQEGHRDTPSNEPLEWHRLQRKIEEERQKSVAKNISSDPPSFYDAGIPKVPPTIIDLDMALKVTRLGLQYTGKGTPYYRPTLMIEWNRKNDHHFALLTQLPDAQGHSVKIYSRISPEIAKHLVEQEGIPSTLGYYEGEVNSVHDFGAHMKTDFTPDDKNPIEKPLLECHKGMRPGDDIEWGAVPEAAEED